MTEAIETLRDIAGNHDTLYLIYIVDEKQHLLGNFLATNYSARPDATINEVMTTDVVYATVMRIRSRSPVPWPIMILSPCLWSRDPEAGRELFHDDAMDIAEAESTEIF